MTRLAIMGFLVLLAAESPLSEPSVAWRAHGDQDQSSRIDVLLSRWVRTDTPGAAIIVIQNGRVLHEKGYGLADVTTREAITSRTVFDIASLSKQFTAMAVLMLVDDGALRFG